MSAPSDNVHIDSGVAVQRAEAVAAPPLIVAPCDRSPPASSAGSVAPLIAASILAHAMALPALMRAPTSLPSLEEHTISVEIVLGADTAAGAGSTPSEEASIESAAASESPADPNVDPLNGLAVRPSAQVPPEHVPEPQAERPPTALAAEDQPQMPTVAETPAEPERAPISEPERLDTAEAVVPQPPAPPHDDPPAPQHDEAAGPQQVEMARLPDPSTAPRTQPESAGSNSIGRGRSVGDPNYLGRVVAHLARHKRYPAEARSKRQTGKAVISFSVDRDGRVSAVRLVSSAGSGSLDLEALAMVQRASPLPRPPGGEPLTLTAPVSFSLAR